MHERQLAVHVLLCMNVLQCTPAVHVLLLAYWLETFQLFCVKHHNVHH